MKVHPTLKERLDALQQLQQEVEENIDVGTISKGNVLELKGAVLVAIAVIAVGDGIRFWVVEQIEDPLGVGVVVSIYLVTRLPETRGMDLVRRRAAPTATTGQTRQGD